MKLNEQASEVLHRYIFAVKRELSGKEREDISKELESHILDLLEERFSGKEELIKEELTQVLEEMGAPRKVAAQYASQRYLIGPQIFPTFFLVLRIVVLVVIGALTISFLVSTMLGEPGSLGKSILEYLGSLFSGALSAVGSVVIVFAIIERVSEYKPLEELKELEEFKVNELPELPLEEQKFSRSGTIVELVLGSIGIAFLLYIASNGGRLPFCVNTQSEMQMVRFLTDGFLRAVPLMIVVAVLDIIHDSLLLRQGYHNSLTNWWKICTQVINMVVMVVLLSSRPLVTLTSQVIAGIAPHVDFVHIESLVNLALTIALSLGLFGLIVDSIKRIIVEVRNPKV